MTKSQSAEEPDAPKGACPVLKTSRRGVCVCDEDANVAYGAVVACELAGATLTITYTPEAAANLSTSQRCRYPLELDPQTIERVREGLRRVLTTGRCVTNPLLL